MPQELGIDTRHRILDAAAEVFAQKGFRAATIASIAHSAGLNAITVYRHFPKKQLIYWEAIDRCLRNSGFLENVHDAMRKDCDPLGFFNGVAGEAIRCLDRTPALTRLLYFAALELESEKKLLFRVYVRPMLQLLTDRIQEWVRAGKARDVSPEAVAMLIVGVIVSYCNLHEFFGDVPPGNLSPDEMAQHCAEICFSGLTPA